MNIIAEGLDAGIRFSEAIERDMVQVRLTDPGRFVVAGAPSYLARRGTPQKPQDLLQHDCICIRTSTGGARYAWELERGKKAWRVPVEGTVTTNDTELMRLLAVAGFGLLYTFISTNRSHHYAGVTELARREARILVRAVCNASKGSNMKRIAIVAALAAGLVVPLTALAEKTGQGTSFNGKETNGIIVGNGRQTGAEGATGLTLDGVRLERGRLVR